jgi:ribosomal-protein-alanine N-acetyltransferase
MGRDVVFGSPLPAILLTDGVVRLRPFEQRDVAVVEEAAGHDLIPKISTVPTHYTIEAGRAYIDRQRERLTSGAGWSLAIADVDTDTAMGQVGLWISQLSKGRAEIGYWVAPSERGHGVAALAVRLLADWAFANIDVDRLSLFIEPSNHPSISTAERAGFSREGVLRGWERIDGEPRDMVSFVRLRTARSA